MRILVNGAKGRMGQLAARTIEHDTDLTLVAETDHNDPLMDTIKKTQANIVVDFTNADAVFENTQAIIEADAHPVIGTSGLLPHQISQLQTQCDKKKLGGIIVPNFSISAVLMMHFAKEAARFMPHVEIIELHHDKKQDAPSGTAVKTAEMIYQSTTIENTSSSKETIQGARGACLNNIPIHSIRLPGLLAHQEVLFGNTGETLSIRQDSIDRACFMPGVLLACKKVYTLNTLIYGLDQLLFDKN